MIPAVLIFCTGLLLLVFFLPLGLIVTAVGGVLIVLVLLRRANRKTSVDLERLRRSGIPPGAADETVSPPTDESR